MRPPVLSVLLLLSLGGAGACGSEGRESSVPAAPDANALLPGAWLGHALVALDDRDGDGVPDLAVGAPGHSAAGRLAGAVHLLSGRDGARLARLEGPRAWAVFGSSLAALPLAGEAGAIGEPSGVLLAVGAPKDAALGLAAGSLAVFGGPDSLRLWQRGGERPGDHLGFALAACGDLDGDGRAELLAGAPAPDTRRAGAAFVFSGAGGTPLLTLAGARPDDRFGASVAAIGDVDGDGHPDLLVGAPGDDTRAPFAGRVALHSGADGSLLRQWFGVAPFDAFGSAVAGPGDLNGDGIPDLAVGAPSDDEAFAGAGAVLAFSGRDGTLLWRASGAAPDEDFGATLGPVGDVDGDGVPDLWAGAIHAAAGRGVLRILSGADGRVLGEFTGERAGTGFGFAATLRPAGGGEPAVLAAGAYLTAEERGAVSLHPLPGAR